MADENEETVDDMLSSVLKVRFGVMVASGLSVISVLRRPVEVMTGPIVLLSVEGIMAVDVLVMYCVAVRVSTVFEGAILEAPVPVDCIED